MNETTSDYLMALKLKLTTSEVVAGYEIVKERATATDGYLRVKIELANGDFLEAAEYFERGPEGITTVDYRYQWMDAERKRLRRRWDSTPDHPELDNFPHHIHLDGEENVVPGEALSIIQVLDVIEREIASP